MRVKICGIKTEKDIDALVKADADAAGFLVGQLHTSQDFILAGTAARLAKQLPPYITPVLVTHFLHADEVIDLLSATSIRTVQLHGGNSLEDVRKIRDWLPPSGKIIYTIHVGGNTKAAELHSDLYPCINAILLDSCNHTTGQIGGTGEVHNWDISASLAKSSPVPVILAGGLNAGNISHAIRKVHPYGVDVNSSVKAQDGNRDPEKCRLFVRTAKEAAWSE